ncbi:EamA family transporter [Actinoallomurus soli]|uniref:EamA family transporter n=1 Tax=Actinoallomurus soli TaxID=2952535 RepID=UPI002091E6DC|nr:DMT family transporter [Actinoallomurus soli]MCO5972361.1 DMT family transporter [Actinoallomurus soli]
MLQDTRRRRAIGRTAGLILAATAAVLWGVGGVAAQELFHRHGIDPRWLVAVRMAGAGLLLLAVFRPAWPGRHIGRLLVLGLVGMAATQYTWFAAIEHSDVATATFLQYNAIAITAGWQMLRGEVRPSPGRLAALAAAGVGVALLILGRRGGLAALRIGPLGVVFGLASAVAFAYYMLASARMVRVIGSGATTAWGLSIASVPMLIWAPPWRAHPVGDAVTVTALTAIVVVLSTALAFSLSVTGLRHITATESAIVSTIEPAVAGLAGALFLGVRLLPLQYLGAALTLAAVLLLTAAGRPPDDRPGAPGR